MYVYLNICEYVHMLKFVIPKAEVIISKVLQNYSHIIRR